MFYSVSWALAPGRSGPTASLARMSRSSIPLYLQCLWQRIIGYQCSIPHGALVMAPDLFEGMLPSREGSLIGLAVGGNLFSLLVRHIQW